MSLTLSNGNVRLVSGRLRRTRAALARPRLLSQRHCVDEVFVPPVRFSNSINENAMTVMHKLEANSCKVRTSEVKPHDTAQTYFKLVAYAAERGRYISIFDGRYGSVSRFYYSLDSNMVGCRTEYRVGQPITRYAHPGLVVI